MKKFKILFVAFCSRAVKPICMHNAEVLLMQSSFGQSYTRTGDAKPAALSG